MEKILIVDDSILEIKILADILQDRYDILACRSGIDGLEVAYQEDPALILLDIIMPEADGFEILERLKENEKTKDIPVIFLTGLEDVATEEKGLLMGAVDYIRKPYNPNIIRARVRTHVRMYRYRRTIETKMSVDVLTDVHNRNDYEHKKTEYWNKAIKEQIPISAMIADIDYFKMVNDTYGHSEGDYVLRHVSGKMKEVLSKHGKYYIARYGGEEFCIILYGLDQRAAFEIAEEIRQEVRGLEIPNQNSPVAPVVTISIGGNTAAPDREEELAGFFHAMDDMLYRAKKQGRNRVEWA